MFPPVSIVWSFSGSVEDYIALGHDNDASCEYGDRTSVSTPELSQASPTHLSVRVAQSLALVLFASSLDR